MAPRNNASLLVFVHLRKTAGTTISWVMRRQFGRGEVIDLNASSVEAANAAWNEMTTGQRARVRGIRGHFPYESNLFTPRNTTFFTMLRDPVERVVSEYYFNLRNPGERFHQLLTRERMTLDQFVNSSVSAEVHNAQSRALADAGTGACAEELLYRATNSLRVDMAVVGLTERLDETLLLCRAILGWRRIVYRNVNVNRYRPALATIAPATIAGIEGLNSSDRKLYRFAVIRFEELLREHRISESQVSRLRLARHAYGAMRRVIGFPRELWIEMQMASSRHQSAKGKA